MICVLVLLQHFLTALTEHVFFFFIHLHSAVYSSYTAFSRRYSPLVEDGLLMFFLRFRTIWRYQMGLRWLTCHHLYTVKGGGHGEITLDLATTHLEAFEHASDGSVIT
jgi:hypothetical protein